MNNEKTENYMDKFETPEEFIRHQILARGNFSTLQKKDLYQMIRKQNIDFTPNKHGLAYTKKQDLLDAVLTKVSYRELSRYVDVSRQSFCMKFNITVDEFKILVQKNLIHKTNEHMGIKFENGSYSKYSQWCGYDVYDYFNLTKEVIAVV